MLSNRIVLVWVVICWLWVEGGLAQSVPGQPWTLAYCIEYAWQNNIQVRLNKLSIESAEHNLIAARQAKLPNLNFNASHNYNWGRSFDVFTNAPVTERVQSNGFSLSSNVTIFNGFQQNRSNDQREKLLMQAKADLAQNKNDVALNLAGFYLQILLNKELLETAKLQVANIKEQMLRMQKLVDAGAAPDADLLDLKSQLSNGEVQVIQARNNLNISTLQLKQVLQIESGEAFDVVVPNLGVPDTSILAMGIDQVYESALGNQPSIKSAQLSKEASDLGMAIAKGAYSPTLSISGGISTAYSSAQEELLLGRTEFREQEIGYVKNLPGSGDLTPVFTLTPDPNSEPIVGSFGFTDQLDESFNQRVSLNLSVPIYNRYQVKNGVEQARIQQQQADLQIQLARNELRQAVEQAHYDAQAALETFKANQVRLSSQEETYRVTKKRFEQSIANSVDFNVALNNLNAAKSDLIQSKYSLIFRLAILNFYQGNELRF